MTEVPDYLLQRSRDRRAALGLEAGEAGSAAPVPAATSAAAAVPAAAAAAPVPATAPAPKAEPVKPDNPMVVAAKTRKKVPVWMAPVLLFTPVWMLMWFGTLEEPAREAEGPLAVGGEVYAVSCASCHGGGGGGGAGRVLNGGEVLKTFPITEDEPTFYVAEQVWWIFAGSPAAGTPYGDPNREGGQHASGSYNGNPMPGFASLTPEEIVSVTLYERVTHGGEPEEELAGWLAWIETGGLEESFPDGFPDDLTATTVQEAFNAWAEENPDLAPELAAG